MKIQKVLVTGGSGYLGSHIADALSNKGYVVTILDQKESKYLRSDQEQILGNINNLNFLKSVLSNFDAVYHMAAIADIDECHKRPIDTMNVNILGTVKLLEACREANIKRFIFASSAYVYSESGSFYKISKQACEQMVQEYQKLYGIDFVILRYGSLYGSTRCGLENSIYRTLKQAIEEKKITYKGTGEEKREFIHILDAAKLSVEVLNDEYVNQNIILTGSSSIKYSELLLMIKEMMNDSIEIEFEKRKSSAHYKLTPYSFSPKLGKKLAANPHVDLGQGLLQLLEELHQNIFQNINHPIIKESTSGKTVDMPIS